MSRIAPEQYLLNISRVYFYCFHRFACLSVGLAQALLEQIRDALREVSFDGVSSSSPFSHTFLRAHHVCDVVSASSAMLTRLSEIYERRASVLAQLRHLGTRDVKSTDVARSGNCSRCRSRGTGPPCVHCQLMRELYEYDHHLWCYKAEAATGTGDGGSVALREDRSSAVEKEADTDEVRRAYLGATGGFRSASHVEVALVATATFLKSHERALRLLWMADARHRGLDSSEATQAWTESVFRAAERHVALFPELRREVKQFFVCWRAQYDQLSALDELEMATVTIRLRYDICYCAACLTSCTHMSHFF